MASIDKRPDGRWRARWREYPGGPQRTKHFSRKVDAENWLTKTKHDLLVGSYIDPKASKVTVGAYAAQWLARMEPTWRPSTTARIHKSINRHVLPAFGDRPLTSIKKSDVEALYAAMTLSPTTVATVHQHLTQLLGAALEDGLLVRNPTARARLPRGNGSKAQPVPLDVADRIASALPDWLAVVVPLAVGAGLRQGEVTGLTVNRIDFLRRRLLVDRQLLSPDARSPHLGPVKTNASNRTVPLATFVLDALAGHLSRFPGAGDDFVIRNPQGQPVDADQFGYRWRKACIASGAPAVRYHDLRHTFASMLLSAGTSVKAVADWLGHASPAVTLNVYSHLMPTDENVARTVIDAALSRPAEDLLRTGEGPATL